MSKPAEVMCFKTEIGLISIQKRSGVPIKENVAFQFIKQFVIQTNERFKLKELPISILR